MNGIKSLAWHMKKADKEEGKIVINLIKNKRKNKGRILGHTPAG